ncbi:DUF2750 domain-containing protein [Marinimicrobium alkaliphilum]|uniref:DUF2750 domain-containing protein n=1 Tax=Marinimicrobium alkaliphilum TaxID=2202654 RepID=UPI000DBA21DF|nr:DUF2750 domain-containing protein [Marinimicrobium alkaliphilum]
MEPLSDDLTENFDRFVVEAIATGCVWGLEGAEGWALCPSEVWNTSDVMPLWSQQEFALAHCQDEWKDYKPQPISLEELLDDWLPGMHDDGLLIGVNWNDELEGEEIEPLDLLHEFEQELS